MTGLLEALGDTARGVALAVGPLVVFFVAFQLLFLKLPKREVGRILKGTLLASAGLFLFLLGVKVGFLPFGQVIGAAVGHLPDAWLLLLFGIVLGFVTTWGEPAVRILAGQVETASSGSIHQPLVVWTVSLGVAAAVGIGMYRIGSGIPLLWLVVPGYALAIMIMGFCEPGFVGIAIDAGGVATGPLANTFLLALALGVSAGMGHEDPLVHGLGMLALISLASVLSVMVLGAHVRWKERRRSRDT